MHCSISILILYLSSILLSNFFERNVIILTFLISTRILVQFPLFRSTRTSSAELVTYRMCIWIYFCPHGASTVVIASVRYIPLLYPYHQSKSRASYRLWDIFSGLGWFTSIEIDWWNKKVSIGMCRIIYEHILFLIPNDIFKVEGVHMVSAP